ncbi:MAG: acyl carrier protein [Anaerolineae bacterium]|jgi:acyl carrier protein|nr:MAG: acyl carrier protein [Anaerolineae bacterium]
MEELLNDLSKFIAETILQNPSRKIKPTEALISSGLLDSFHLVDLAIYIEERFGVKIEDTELNRQTFDNLQELSKIVFDRMQGK